MTPNRALTRRLLWPAILVAGLALCGLVAWGGALSSGSDLAARRARVEALSPLDKEQLLEHQKRFARLTSEEQKRLRRLNRQIDEHAHGPELRAVMHSYGDWLRTLPLSQQAELADLHGTERVAEIKKLQEDQAKEAASRPGPFDLARGDWRKPGPWPRGRPGAPPLNPEDVEGLLKWIEDYVKGRGTQSFLKHLPEAKRKEFEEQLAGTTDQLRRLEIFAMMWLRPQLGEPGKAPPGSPKELADLRAKLSAETRKRLESSSPEEQWRMIRGMTGAYLFHQYWVRGGAQAAPPVGLEELADFFEKHLTPQERDLLLSLPGEEVQRKLWRMYMNWKYPPPYPGRRDGRPPGPPKGFGPPRKAVPGDGLRPDPPVPKKLPGGKRAPEAEKPPAPDGT